MPKLYLIDSSVYVFRAWHSLPDTITDPQGEPVNAVYGFGTFLAKFLQQTRPTHVAAVFDESLTTSFRNAFFADYKSNRELPPAELERQFAACRRLARALGITDLASRRYEADDIIGTIARRLRPRGFSMVYVSRDKDLLQLLEPGDVYWDFADDRRVTVRTARQALGVRADQVVDYLALTGDPVDNIPGVPGIGPKTAGALLARFGSLDGVFANLDRIPALGLRGAARIRDVLAAHRKTALLARRLVRIHTNARIRVTPQRLEWRGVQWAKVERLFAELGFGERLRDQLRKLG